MSVHVTSSNTVTGSSAITEINSPVWKAYNNRDYHGLTQLAKDSLADFSVLTNSMKQTIFHKSVVDNADGRLKAIESGFKEGNRLNTSITNTINGLCEGKTALFMAAESWYLYYQGTQPEILLSLMSIGADPNIPFESPKGSTRKPIDVAPSNIKTVLNPDLLTSLQHGELSRAHNLLKDIQSSSSINPLPLKDCDNNNGMLLAITKWEKNKNAEERVIKVITILNECGEDFNHKNVRGETVLGLAIMKGYRNIIKYLILDPSVTWSYNNCGTIVHLAAGCEAKDVDILKLLISNKPACVTTQNDIGRTPLHYVRCIEAADCLIEAGADVNAKDKLEKTPISYTLAKNELLSDWMRLFDPNLDAQTKAQIIHKHSWAQSVESKIIQLSPTSFTGLPSSLIKGAKSILEEAKPTLAAMLVTALRNLGSKN